MNFNTRGDLVYTTKQ